MLHAVPVRTPETRIIPLACLVSRGFPQRPTNLEWTLQPAGSKWIRTSCSQRPDDP